LEFSYDQGNPAEVAFKVRNFLKIRVNIFGDGIAACVLFPETKQFAASRRKHAKCLNSESGASAAEWPSKAGRKWQKCQESRRGGGFPSGQ
jgi:hypothetical protein